MSCNYILTKDGKKIMSVDALINNVGASTVQKLKEALKT
jgi:hypothetical protein